MPTPTLQETRILPTDANGNMTVEVIVADHPDEERATFYLCGRCIVPPHPEFPKKPLLLTVQRLALHVLREAIDAEMIRISGQ